MTNRVELFSLRASRRGQSELRDQGPETRDDSESQRKSNRNAIGKSMECQREGKGKSSESHRTVIGKSSKSHQKVIGKSSECHRNVIGTSSAECPTILCSISGKRYPEALQVVKKASQGGTAGLQGSLGRSKNVLGRSVAGSGDPRVIPNGP